MKEERKEFFEEEPWDIYRLAQEVAELCAKHAAPHTACVFAAASPYEEDRARYHVAAMIGGETADSPAFGDILIVLGGKIFQSNYMEPVAQTAVHRNRAEEGHA